MFIEVAFDLTSYSAGCKLACMPKLYVPRYRQSVSWAVPLDGPCEPEEWARERGLQSCKHG